MGYYFKLPSDLAFHALTDGTSVPPVAKTILGLSTKFILVPKHNSRIAFERLEQDVSLKVVYFAGEEETFVKTKLYNKST